MERRMKRVDYRPEEFKSMDPSVRTNVWKFERTGGHLFADIRCIATYQSALMALVIGDLFGGLFLFTGSTEKDIHKLLTYGPDGDKKKK